MSKPFCQLTIQDLLTMINEEKKKSDPQGSNPQGGKTEFANGNWFSPDEIAEILNPDPDILSRTMEKVSDPSQTGQLPVFQPAHRTPGSQKGKSYFS
jgi:hypothetical protein